MGRIACPAHHPQRVAAAGARFSSRRNSCHQTVSQPTHMIVHARLHLHTPQKQYAPLAICRLLGAAGCTYGRYVERVLHANTLSQMSPTALLLQRIVISAFEGHLQVRSCSAQSIAVISSRGHACLFIRVHHCYRLCISICSCRHFSAYCHWVSTANMNCGTLCAGAGSRWQRRHGSGRGGQHWALGAGSLPAGPADLVQRRCCTGNRPAAGHPCTTPCLSERRLCNGCRS